MITTRLGLCAALLISLCGCFDLTEEVHVHENGQGTHKIEQRVHAIGNLMGPDELKQLKSEVREMVEELKANPKVVDAEGDAEIEDGDLITKVAYTVKHFTDLDNTVDQTRAEALRIAEEHELGGDFRFEELEKGNWRWTYPLYDEDALYATSEARRQIRIAKTVKSPEERQAALEEQAPTGSITYRFSAPQVFKAEGSELDGGEATWHFPLDPEDEVEIPAELTAEFSLTAPFPWGYALIGGGLSFGLVGGLWLRRKWNKRWE